jgi:malonyl-CoA/methylmalonyl-CoA synthetase
VAAVSAAFAGRTLRVQDDDGKSLHRKLADSASERTQRLAYARRRPKKNFTPTVFSKPAMSEKIDERGYITIVGCSKDLIISGGGYNVYPAEIGGLHQRPARRLRARCWCRTPDFGEVGRGGGDCKAGYSLRRPTPSLQLKPKLAQNPKQCFQGARAAATPAG